jgi:hypothetical protein
VVLGGAAAILMVTAVSVGILGWKIHEDFLSSVLGNHLIAKLDMQDPFTVSYQSFDSLFRRLFIYDDPESTGAIRLASTPRYCGIDHEGVDIYLRQSARSSNLPGGAATAQRGPSIGLLGVVTLLLAPATATYHFVLLWLPVGLLIDYFVRRAPACAPTSFSASTRSSGSFLTGIPSPLKGAGDLRCWPIPDSFFSWRCSSLASISFGPGRNRPGSADRRFTDHV